MDIYKDKLVLCGSGNTRPTYKVVSLTNYSTLFEESTRYNPAIVCASPNPDHRVTGKITELGEMISATYPDISGHKSEVVSEYVTEKMTVYRQGLTTQEMRSVSPKSTFVNSFYINDSVYIFFMESAKENYGIMTPTVGRFCQTDNGGSAMISPRMWTTFRKARLNCKYSENELQFNNLGISDI